MATKSPAKGKKATHKAAAKKSAGTASKVVSRTPSKSSARQKMAEPVKAKNQLAEAAAAKPKPRTSKK